MLGSSKKVTPRNYVNIPKGGAVQLQQTIELSAPIPKLWDMTLTPFGQVLKISYLHLLGKELAIKKTWLGVQPSRNQETL
jgi:hypothetical protein